MSKPVVISVREWVPREFTEAQVALWWAKAWYRAGAKHMLLRHGAQRSFWASERARAREYRLQERRCDRRMNAAIKRRNKAERAPEPDKPASGRQDIN